MFIKNPIIAISTSLNKSAIGIIRFSLGNLNNKKIKNIIIKIFNKKLFNRKAIYVSIKGLNNIILDNGIAIYFKSPNSYTGENMIEFHGHGNPFNLKFIVKNILIVLKNYNIKLAKPGEFTKRAFENKKLNLIQIENFFNIINFNKNIINKNFIFFLNFNLSFKLKKILLIINKLRLKINYFLNFENKFKSIFLIYDLNYIKKKFLEILKNFKNIKKNLSFLIIGYPNTGKSTLSNRLNNENYILTSNFFGTTRDLIKTKLNFKYKFINLFDSTGLYKTNNIIENLGIKKTINKFKKSNFILYIFFNNNFIYNNYYLNLYKIYNKKKVIINVNNKIDFYNSFFFLEFFILNNYFFIDIKISSLKKNGIIILLNEIKRLSFKINIDNFSFNFKNNYIKILKFSFKRLNNIFDYYKFKKIDILNEELFFLNNIIYNLINKKYFNYFDNIFNKFCLGK